MRTVIIAAFLVGIGTALAIYLTARDINKKEIPGDENITES